MSKLTTTSQELRETSCDAPHSAQSSSSIPSPALSSRAPVTTCDLESFPSRPHMASHSLSGARRSDVRDVVRSHFELLSTSTACEDVSCVDIESERSNGVHAEDDPMSCRCIIDECLNFIYHASNPESQGDHLVLRLHEGCYTSASVAQRAQEITRLFRRSGLLVCALYLSERIDVNGLSDPGTLLSP